MNRLLSALEKMKKTGEIASYSTKIQSPFAGENDKFKSWEKIGVKTFNYGFQVPVEHHAVVPMTIRFHAPKGDVPFADQVERFKASLKLVYPEMVWPKPKKEFNYDFTSKIPAKHGGIYFRYKLSRDMPRTLLLQLFVSRIPFASFPADAKKSILERYRKTGTSPKRTPFEGNSLAGMVETGTREGALRKSRKQAEKRLKETKKFQDQYEKEKQKIERENEEK